MKSRALLINKETITGLLVLLFSIVFLIEVFSWRDYSHMRVIGPEVFPKFILAFMGLLSLKIIWDGIKQAKVTSGETTEGEEEVTTFKDKLESATLIISIIVIVILYALTIRSMGFIFNTFVSLFLMMWVMGVKGWFYRLIFSIVITLGIYVIFIYFLKLPFPTGTIWR